MSACAVRPMYPDIEPYDTGMLKVSDIHQVYYEQSGNKAGNPVIFMYVPILHHITLNHSVKKH